MKADITWLPHRAQFAPWTVPIPKTPDWANIVHINSWLPRRFIPDDRLLVVTHHSSVHDPALTPYKGPLRNFYHQQWIKRWERYNAHRASILTAVSHYTAEQAARTFGRLNIQTIYNWIDTDIFSTNRRKRPHDPFRLLFVGKLRKLKGSDLLPKIMVLLGPKFELWYTGSPKGLGTTKIPKNMTPIGRLEGDAALVDAYQNADALLLPSRLEGFSLVTLEAHACGLPVLTTDVASLPEVVVHQQTGILCPIDDVDAFAAAARSLRDQPERWRHMSEQARTRAVHYFGEENALQKWISLYKSCLSSTCSAPAH